MSSATTPRGTPAPGSLSAMAISIVRSDPEYKWFGGIEDRMNLSEDAAQGARDQAVRARIDMMRSKAAMALATTVSSDVYATAVLRDASATEAAKASAKAVTAWRDVLDASMAEVRRARDLSEVEKAVRKVALAKWSMLEDAGEMMAVVMNNGGAATPKQQQLPTVVPLLPCPSGHPKLTAGRGTPRQRKLLAYLTSMGMEFVAHMFATRPKDVLTRNLLMWNRYIESYSVLAEVTTSSHAVTIGAQGGSRCIGVAYDSFSSLPRMLVRLLHELGHVANPGPGAHSPEFYTIFRSFLRIASEEMGWVLEATCRETCFGSTEPGYDPRSVCPRCVWQTPPEECTAQASDCEPAQIDRTKLAKMHAKDASVLAFLGVPPPAKGS